MEAEDCARELKYLILIPCYLVIPIMIGKCYLKFDNYLLVLMMNLRSLTSMLIENEVKCVFNLSYLFYLSG